MRYLAIFFILMSSAYATETWKVLLLKTLPSPLQKVIPGKTTLKEVEKNLGKANLVEKNKQYYELDDLKYALEITYNNSKVKEYSYTYTKKQPDFSDLKINPNLLTNEGGSRFMKYADKEGEILIDLTSKKIYSVKVR